MDGVQTQPQPTLQWSPQQEKALIAIKEWYEFSPNQVFRLFGYAGTGKTTLAREIANLISGGDLERIAFGAYTGKAALVLRKKGCVGASTIHSMIYKQEHTKACYEKRKRDKENDEEGGSCYCTGQMLFSLKSKNELSAIKLVIIDECSMVDEEMGKDLLSFGKKILVLGDPMQLPPIGKGDGGYFTSGQPDMLLDEVHRQGKDNPLIYLATKVRRGERADIGPYGASQVVWNMPEEAERIAGTILVGMNRTRKAKNNKYRHIYKGINGPYPTTGELLVCLKNNRMRGLLNGSFWEVMEVMVRDGYAYMTLQSKDQLDLGLGEGSDGLVETRVPLECFLDGNVTDFQRRNDDLFDYGYVVTTHKAQGSEWAEVCIYNESYVFEKMTPGSGAKWLYTAITRASEKVTIALSSKEK